MPKVFCAKLQEELDGLAQPPFPTPLGEKIHQSISAAAWQQWLARQTMFINEYRLNLADKKARAMLMEECERFLFNDADNKPSGYTPEDHTS